MTRNQLQRESRILAHPIPWTPASAGVTQFGTFYVFVNFGFGLFGLRIFDQHIQFAIMIKMPCEAFGLGTVAPE